MLFFYLRSRYISAKQRVTEIVFVDKIFLLSYVGLGTSVAKQRDTEIVFVDKILFVLAAYINPLEPPQMLK